MSDLSNNSTAWLPTIILLIIVVAGYAFRNALKTWINSGIQHTFDARIEKIRSDHVHQIEILKNELKTRDDQIAALREGALAGLISRGAALDKRRMEAVEKLWAGVVSLAPLKGMSAQMQAFKFEVAAKRAIAEPKLRQVFEIIGQGVDPTKLAASDAPKEQPFLSARAWALFSAYRTILHYAFTQVTMLRTGTDPTDLIDHDNIAAIIKAALPEHSSYIDVQGPAAYHYLVETVEQNLLTELQRMLSGAEESAEAVQNAAKILEAVQNVQAEMDAPRTA